MVVTLAYRLAFAGGLALLAFGVGLWSIPAGVSVAGVALSGLGFAGLYGQVSPGGEG